MDLRSRRRQMCFRSSNTAQAFASGLRPSERRHDLGQHSLLLSLIAGREMKGLDAAHIGFSRKFSGSSGCKMGPVARQCGVRTRKCRLNEEDIRVLSERYDRVTIGWRIGDIG